MKTVTVKGPDGKQSLSVLVVSPVERNRALRARGIDPRTIKSGHLTKKDFPVRIV